jgi:hypothetical protein
MALVVVVAVVFVVILLTVGGSHFHLVRDEVQEVSASILCEFFCYMYASSNVG